MTPTIPLDMFDAAKHLMRKVLGKQNGKQWPALNDAHYERSLLLHGTELAAQRLPKAMEKSLDAAGNFVETNRRTFLAAAAAAILFQDKLMPEEGPAERDKKFFAELMRKFPQGHRINKEDPATEVTGHYMPDKPTKLVIWVDDCKIYNMRPILDHLHEHGVDIYTILNADVSIGTKEQQRVYTERREVLVQNATHYKEHFAPEHKRDDLPHPNGLHLDPFLEQYIDSFSSMRNVPREESLGRITMVHSGRSQETARHGHRDAMQIISPEHDDPRFAVVTIGQKEGRVYSSDILARIKRKQEGEPKNIEGVASL